jgi:hypothetical protein
VNFSFCAALLLQSFVLVRGSWAQTQAAAPGGEPRASAHAIEVGVGALVSDVHRIVEAEESSGWLLDESAARQIHPALMESVCRALPAVRGLALSRLERESQTAGDPRTVYAEDGEELTGRVEEALTARRALDALDHAVRVAPRQCPFWLRPEPNFRGRQSTRDRAILNFDTGGTVQLRRTEGDWSLGAGGFGRLLGGYSFTRVSVLAGIELGGGAMLEPKTDPTQFVINYFPALPVIVRLHYQAWHVDVEGAAVALFQAGNTDLSYGARGGLTVGISALRLRGILPWVGLGFASEYHFDNAARPHAVYLRGGLRVGGVWDP